MLAGYFFLPVLEDIRMFKGCPEEVPLAQPFAPTPAVGLPVASGAGRRPALQWQVQLP